MSSPGMVNNKGMYFNLKVCQRDFFLSDDLEIAVISVYQFKVILRASLDLLRLQHTLTGSLHLL